jgi:dolichyl-phosphate beta-glucosyltransferase
MNTSGREAFQDLPCQNAGAWADDIIGRYYLLELGQGMTIEQSPTASKPASVDISVILPGYRAGKLAIDSVKELEATLAGTSYSFEIIVVDDGSHDIAPIWPESFNKPSIRLLSLPANQGKGGAVRAGMLAANGKVRIFTDIDLPYELDLFGEIARLILVRGFHVVIGDRTLSGSSYALDIGLLRRLASAVFSTFVGRLVTGGFFDTQCGLKGFRADVAEEVFKLGQLRGFSFDVELIYLCLIYRLDIKRIPVRLRNNETSSVNVIRDSIKMFLDVLSIKWKSMSGTYKSAYLNQLVSEEFNRERKKIESQD